MVQYITTPWRTHSSLLAVRSALYPSPTSPSTTTDLKEAIALVSIWAQRGGCPHLVESTALLSAALLNDDPRNGTWCIRAAYASSFSRFVTGLLDSHQTSKRKISMYALAKTLDLPATYVELRHQATHEELPSLQKLRGAARKALRWIWERYWVDLAEEEEGGEKERDVEVEEDGEGRDSEALLREVRSSRRGLGGDEDRGIGGSRSIEDVRRELARAKEDLYGEVDEDQGVREAVQITEITDEGGEGWAMWEGPWTPTPIGTVRC